MKNERPFGVTMLALLVLSLSALGLLRFGTAVSQWNIIAEFAPRPGPLYIMLTGLVWILIGFPLFICLWLGNPFARQAVLPAAIIYSGYYWFDRLSFQVRFAPNNWLFALGATITLLVFTSIVVILPATKMFFSDSMGKNYTNVDTYEE